MPAVSCKIFVSVGFAFQDFSRLIREMDKIAAIPEREVFMQIGSCRYEPRNARYIRFCESTEKYVAEADLIVCHGGMSVLDALSAGKPVIAVPRLARYGEVLNDHQLEFIRRLEDRPGVFPVYGENIPPDIITRALRQRMEPSIGSDNRDQLIRTLRSFAERSRQL